MNYEKNRKLSNRNVLIGILVILTIAIIGITSAKTVTVEEKLKTTVQTYFRGMFVKSSEIRKNTTTNFLDNPENKLAEKILSDFYMIELIDITDIKEISKDEIHATTYYSYLEEKNTDSTRTNTIDTVFNRVDGKWKISEFITGLSSNQPINFIDKDIIPNGGEYKVYSLDINTDNEVILSTIGFESNVTTVEDKLQKLGSYLAEVKFAGLPIELIKVEAVDGKKVATFNLKEAIVNENEENWGNYVGENWFNYCSGSAGGHNTTFSLTKTLLQPQYSGEWIDGVVFKYKGGDIPFQHAEGLSRITYRNGNNIN